MSIKTWRNTQISIGPKDTLPEAVTTWVPIGHVFSAGGSFGVNWTTADATTFDDDFRADVKVMKDSGSFDIGFRLVIDDAGQEDLRAAADDEFGVYPFQVALNDMPAQGTTPTTYEFSALVTSFAKGSSGAVGGLVDWGSRLEVQGATTYTEAA